MLSRYVLKMPGDVIRGYLRAFFGCLWSLDASEGLSECSALVMKEMALCWNCSEMQDFFNLILLRHQNTKTRWYKFSKNHWVMALFENSRCATEKLQFTVALDHPVHN